MVQDILSISIDELISAFLKTLFKSLKNTIWVWCWLVVYKFQVSEQPLDYHQVAAYLWKNTPLIVCGLMSVFAFFNFADGYAKRSLVGLGQGVNAKPVSSKNEWETEEK